MIQLFISALLVAFSLQLFSATRAHGVIARTWSGLSKEMLYGAIVTPFDESMPYWDVEYAYEIVRQYFSSSFDSYKVHYVFDVLGEGGMSASTPMTLVVVLKANLGMVDLDKDYRVFVIQEGENYE